MGASANKAHLGALVAAVCQLGQAFYPRPEIWTPVAVILSWLAIYFIPNAEA